MARGITKDWSIGLDESYQSRIVEEHLVFWKRCRTIYIDVWNRPEEESKAATLAWIKSCANPDPIRRHEAETDGVLQYGYLLKESDERHEYFAFHGFSVAEKSYVQIAFYFDDPDDLSWAEEAWRSLHYTEE